MKLPEALKDPRPRIHHLIGALGAQAIYMYEVWGTKFVETNQYAYEMIAAMGVGAVIASGVVAGSKRAIGSLRSAQNVDGTGSYQNDGQEGNQGLYAHESLSHMS